MSIFTPNALSNKLIMNGLVVVPCFCPIIFCVFYNKDHGTLGGYARQNKEYSGKKSKEKD